MLYAMKERGQLVDRVGKLSVNVARMPVLGNILSCWSEFKDKFYSIGENIKKAVLFENEILGEDFSTCVESVVFDYNRYRRLRDRIKAVRIEDTLDVNGGVIAMVDMNRKWNVNINWAEYFRLRTGIIRILDRYEETVDKKDSKSLNEFVESRKRGCKRYRMVMIGRRTNWYKEKDPKGIASAVTLWGGDLVNISRLQVELNFSSWKIMRLDSDFKNFLFKLIQGRLFLNQALAHFAHIRPACTFCSIVEKRRMRGEGIEEDGQEWLESLNRLSHESIGHLFWDCQYVKPVINGLGQRLSGTVGTVFKKKEFMSGLEDISIKNMKMTILIVHFIKYQIYISKCRYKLPSVPQIMYEWEGLKFNLSRGEIWREPIEDIRELVTRMVN
jgi:hypothetical protein